MPRARNRDLVEWAGGVHVAGTRLWCDAARTQALVLWSGADVTRPRARLLASEATARLAGGALDDVLVSPYGRPFAYGRARLELLPAGRLPGATQLRVELDGRALLLAGAVRPEAGRLAEPAQLRPCDVLVLAAPLAALARPLPPRAEEEARLVDAARAALAAGSSPTVRAATLGVALDVAALLGAAGVTLAAPAGLAALIGRARRGGVALPSVRRGRPRAGEVALLVADAAAAAPGVLDVGGGRAFALADTADLPSAVAYAAASGAREVYVTAGWCEPLARALAARGLRARPLGPPEQMALFGVVATGRETG